MTNGPGPVPMPPVKRLRAAGVTVFAGSDNIRDAWSPYGNGDMLERAALIGYRQDFRADEDLALALDLATHAAAKVLGLEDYGLAEGCAADLVAVRAESVAEAVASHPPADAGDEARADRGAGREGHGLALRCRVRPSARYMFGDPERKWSWNPQSRVPSASAQTTEAMPQNACVVRFECPSCGELLAPLEGDCCVFCSYGTAPCPPIQTGNSCCASEG